MHAMRIYDQHLEHRMTEHGMLRLCQVFSSDFWRRPMVMMAYDIIGPIDVELAEQFRPVGVLFRYFATHQDRLAEFQQRLDAAKLRAAR